MEGPLGRGWNLGAVLAQRDLPLCSGEASCAETAHRSQALNCEASTLDYVGHIFVAPTPSAKELFLDVLVSDLPVWSTVVIFSTRTRLWKNQVFTI